MRPQTGPPSSVVRHRQVLSARFKYLTVAIILTVTFILYKVLDKRISADGNTKADVAVNHKGRRREQGTDSDGGAGRDQH